MSQVEKQTILPNQNRQHKDAKTFSFFLNVCFLLEAWGGGRISFLEFDLGQEMFNVCNEMSRTLSL